MSLLVTFFVCLGYSFMSLACICIGANVIGAKPETICQRRLVKQPEHMQHKHAHIHPHMNVNSVWKMVLLKLLYNG